MPFDPALHFIICRFLRFSLRSVSQKQGEFCSRGYIIYIFNRVVFWAWIKGGRARAFETLLKGAVLVEGSTKRMRKNAYPPCSNPRGRAH